MIAVLACLFARAGSIMCEGESEGRYSLTSGSSFNGLCWSDVTEYAAGAAVYVSPTNGVAETYFENCRFYSLHSKSSNGGGAVYIDSGGTHEFHFCEFKDVKSNGKGGAFYASNAQNIVVDSCIFEGAQCESWGGAFTVVLTSGSEFLHVRHAKFLDCFCLETEFYGETYLYDGAVAYCEGPTGGGSGSLASFTFENCTVSYSEQKPHLSCIYVDLTTTEMPLTFQDCVFNAAPAAFREAFLKITNCENVLLKGDSFDEVSVTGASPLLAPAPSNDTPYKWKSLEVVDCDFQSVTSACDGSVVDSQNIVTSIILSNCTFGSCTTTAGTGGGVVVIRDTTTESQILDCHFIANSCTAGVLSLRIISTSFVNLTGCTFSSHTGDLPVLKAEGSSALKSTGDFLINDCVFKDNSLSGDKTGIVAFPSDKIVQFENCTFTNSKASVTLTKCSKVVFDLCFFIVSQDNPYYPVIRDNGTPELHITRCSFTRTGTPPDGCTDCKYVIISQECKPTITQSCFGSDEEYAIEIPSDANIANGENKFGVECEAPWEQLPGPEPEPATTIDDNEPGDGTDKNPSLDIPPENPSLDDDFPYGAVIGGVVGAIVAIAVVVVLVFFFVVKKRRIISGDTNSETLAHSDSLAA